MLPNSRRTAAFHWFISHTFFPLLSNWDALAVLCWPFEQRLWRKAGSSTGGEKYRRFVAKSEAEGNATSPAEKSSSASTSSSGKAGQGPTGAPALFALPLYRKPAFP